MSPHLLINFEIPRSYQNKPKFYSRKNLPQITDGTNVANFDEHKSTGTPWIVLFENGGKVTYFDNFWVEHIPKKKKK